MKQWVVVVHDDAAVEGVEYLIGDLANGYRPEVLSIVSGEVQPTRERLADLLRQVANNARVLIDHDSAYAYTIDELVESAVDIAFKEPQGA